MKFQSTSQKHSKHISLHEDVKLQLTPIFSFNSHYLSEKVIWIVPAFLEAFKGVISAPSTEHSGI